MIAEKMKRTTNAFNYYYERELSPGETVTLTMPPVSPNARGINDIGYLCDDTVRVFATICHNSDKEDAQWQEIDGEEINKTTRTLKFINEGERNASVVVRAILY